MPGLNRRTVVGGGAMAAITGLSGCLYGGGDPAEAERPQLEFATKNIVARASRHRFWPDQPKPTAIWGYDGDVPGDGVQVTQGARIRYKLINNLPQPTTVHWHGIHNRNVMDGVAGLTQEPIPTGGFFRYDFLIKNAGTYWYHPHANTREQVARGMTAPLIVYETDRPDTDADLVLTINDWQLDSDYQIAGLPGTAPSAQRFLTVNGQRSYARAVRKNERLRLRLINSAPSRILMIGARGLEGWVVALDGMPLAAPRRLKSVRLTPAQRADLIVDVTAPEGGQAQVSAGGVALAVFPVTASASTARRDPPKALPPNPTPQIEIERARRLVLRMTGGGPGALASAKVRGEGILGREALIDRGLGWAINGWAGMPETPEIVAAKGESLRLEIINANASPHAMHLHGHHFRELRGGRLGPWRDTIFTPPNSRVEVALNAHNVGEWMFHCHMLDHLAEGMMSWMRVTS